MTTPHDQSPDNWAIGQVDTIALRLNHTHGQGWDKLVGPELARAVRYEQVLLLVLAQAMEKYQPAQELIRRVVREMGEDDQ